MTGLQNYPEELKKVAYLLGDDHHLQAVQRLRAYLTHTPDDLDALTMLAHGLNSLGEYQESLSLANRVLGQQPDDASALDLVADGLIKLRNPEQARGLIETWLAARAGSALRTEVMSGHGLPYTYWRLLMDSQEYAGALRVVEEHGSTDGFWRSCIAKTLIALDRTQEAEAFYSREPVDLRSGLWDMGFLLMFSNKYEEALDYFRRVLSFAKLPGEFNYLLAYLECLHWAGYDQEVEALCLHWLRHISARPASRIRCLHVVLALSYDRRGESEAAREHAHLACKEWDVERCYRRLFQSEMNFEETSDAARVVFAKLLPDRGTPSMERAIV